MPGGSWRVILVASLSAGCFVTACSDGDSAPAPSSMVSSIPDTELRDATTTVETAVSRAQTTDVATSTTISLGPLQLGEFNALLDLMRVRSMSYATDVFDTPPVPIEEIEFDRRYRPCTGSWAIRVGGLTLVFDGESPGSAILTNWGYVGGAVGSYSEIVTTEGLRVGDTFEQLAAVFPDYTDNGGGDYSTDGGLRVRVENGVIVSIGHVDCYENA